MFQWLARKLKGNGRSIPDGKQMLTIGINNNMVIMEFGRPISNIVMDANTAFKVSKAIHERALQCQRIRG